MTEKKQAAALVGIMIPVLLGVGTFLGDMRLDVNALNRDLVELRIKDYRQHRDMIREHLRYGKGQLSAMESAIEADPEFWGQLGPIRVKELRNSVEINAELLENYVEENKHFGRE